VADKHDTIAHWNSHLAPSLLRDVAVSRDVFLEFHTMHGTYLSLKLNFEHQTINWEYKVAKEAINEFENG
jgi:hypothetical protein